MINQVWDWITKGIGHFFSAFTSFVPSLVARFLGAYGLSMISFNAVLPNLRSFIAGYVSGMPSDALNFLGAIGMGEAMSMVISALTITWGSKMFIVPKSVADRFS